MSRDKLLLSGREVLTDVRPRKDDVEPLKFVESALLLFLCVHEGEVITVGFGV